MLRKIPIHPILFAIYPILFLYTNNISMLEIKHTLMPLIWSISGVVLLWFIINFFIKNRFKSSAIASLVTVLFFSYGHIIIAMNRVPENLFGLSSDLYLSLNYILLLLIIIYLIVKYFKNFLPVTRFLNFISFALLVYPLLIVFTYTNPIKPNNSDIKSAVRTNEITIQIPEGSNRPDIYYIILDGYGRSDVLKSIYKYDNEPFLNELENRGFFIARKSQANYAQTTLFSLASSLNMDYLRNTSNGSEEISNYSYDLRSKIKNNKVAEILSQIGYKFVTFSTGYTGTEIKNSDLYLSPNFSLNEFENMIIGTTPFYRLLEIIPNSSPRYLHRQRIIYTIEKLPEIQKQDDPIFVFAHIVAPHAPFVLYEEDEIAISSGNDPLSFDDGSDFHNFNDSLQAEYKTKYIAQLRALNKLVLQMLDKLLPEKKDNLVVILQSDHGPGAFFDWDYPDSLTYTERVPILNSYFFPDSNYNVLYDSITPVNTFRIIFNKFFNMEMELLEDKSYFSKFSNPLIIRSGNNSGE